MAQIRTTSTGQPDQPPEPPPTARIYLQPIAPPVTVGLWGFFGSTMVISTWLLHWWGGSDSATYFLGFNAAFGGVAQFLAGLLSFKARDYISSSLLTMWGTYWMAWGFLEGMDAAGFVTVPPQDQPFPGFAIWFVPLGIFTFAGAITATSRGLGNFPLFMLLLTVGLGCWAVAPGFWMGSPIWIHVGAWLFIVGAAFAWYVASMVMLQSAWGKVILPLGKWFTREGNVPGSRTEFPVEQVTGQPGVRHGQ